MAKSNEKIITTAIFAVLISASGWMVFTGFQRLFRLDELQPITLILGGLGLGILLVKLGIKKLK